VSGYTTPRPERLESLMNEPFVTITLDGDYRLLDSGEVSLDPVLGFESFTLEEDEQNRRVIAILEPGEREYVVLMWSSSMPSRGKSAHIVVEEVPS
jgi:hypothetical protein